MYDTLEFYQHLSLHSHLLLLQRVIIIPIFQIAEIHRTYAFCNIPQKERGRAGLRIWFDLKFYVLLHSETGSWRHHLNPGKVVSKLKLHRNTSVIRASIFSGASLKSSFLSVEYIIATKIFWSDVAFMGFDFVVGE